ncbi:MAG: peptide chain release factor N(5)-glutamine methyltransferase [Proteobacteria bacterium]|nr:peptide chain release factor N(5)-glutamine methyltransferase [Pseudomonadota bacterium]MBU1060601.1 peptide chain release factor N(5)-glutamine methyltransferase [Pseudomonadota bacterium]
MHVRDLLHLASSRLASAGIEGADTDAWLLLGHCMRLSRTTLYLIANQEVDKENEEHFLTLLRRRELREPLAYIVGEQEFWSLDFFVSPDVLIPRPETELLLEKSLAFYKKKKETSGLILDLCCGSGVIAVVLARELDRPVIAVDLSFKAISLARENAKRHNVAHLISFVQADLFAAIAPRPVFSLVLSNPPYISAEALEQGLQAEVGLYEPRLALDGGEKGMEIIRKIRKELPARLLPGAGFFMEIGADQGNEVLSLFSAEKKETSPFSFQEISQDYARHDRIFHARNGAELGVPPSCQR